MAAPPVRVGGRTRTPARRVAAPAIPRRASGAVRGVAMPSVPSVALPTRGLRLSVSPARLIDLLVARRLWIPVLGVLLLGIVFVQVSMLSMNTGIGVSMKRSSALERENAALRADISRLATGNTVADEVAAAGMVVPDNGDYRVLGAGGGDAARRAVAKLSDPKPPVQSSASVAQTTSLTTGAVSDPATSSTTPPATATGQGTTATQQTTTSSSTATPQTGQTSTPAVSSSTGATTATPIVTTPGGGAAAPGM